MIEFQRPSITLPGDQTTNVWDITLFDSGNGPLQPRILNKITLPIVCVATNFRQDIHSKVLLNQLFKALVMHLKHRPYRAKEPADTCLILNILYNNKSMQ